MKIISICRPWGGVRLAVDGLFQKYSLVDQLIRKRWRIPGAWPSSTRPNVKKDNNTASPRRVARCQRPRWSSVEPETSMAPLFADDF